jgi:hypothetical protein
MVVAEEILDAAVEQVLSNVLIESDYELEIT